MDSETDEFDIDLPPSAEFRDEADTVEEPTPEPDNEDHEPEPEPVPEPASSDDKDWSAILGDLDDKPENWDSLLETEAKRRKDSQKSFHDEHQARLRLEHELAELRAQRTEPAAAPAPAPADDDFDEDAFYEDPAAAYRSLQQQQRQSAEALRQEQHVNRIQILEDRARQKHSDYDELVSEFLVPEMQGDNLLQAEWQKAGGTPDAAYDMAKRLRAIRTPSDAAESPAEMEARIRSELEAEIRGKAPKPGRTLSDQGTSRPPPRQKPGAVNLPEDDTELLLEAISY